MPKQQLDLTNLPHGWIDIRKRKPKKGARVLICDDNGYVTIVPVESCNNIHVGKMSWLQSWEFGNGTKIVAWQPLPPYPKNLCNEDADGDIP